MYKVKTSFSIIPLDRLK